MKWILEMCFLGGRSVPFKATVLGLILPSLLQIASVVTLSKVYQNAFVPIMCPAPGGARVLIKSKQGHGHSLRHWAPPLAAHMQGVKAAFTVEYIGMAPRQA